MGNTPTKDYETVPLKCVEDEIPNKISATFPVETKKTELVFTPPNSMKIEQIDAPNDKINIQVDDLISLGYSLQQTFKTEKNNEFVMRLNSFSDEHKKLLVNKCLDHSDAVTMNILGLCCEYGHGIAKNGNDAHTYYTIASEKGNICGTLNLINCYENGIGIGKEPAVAFNICKKFLHTVHPQIFWKLGDMYLKGIGTTKDLQAAFSQYLHSYRLEPTVEKAREIAHICILLQDYGSALTYYYNGYNLAQGADKSVFKGNIDDLMREYGNIIVYTEFIKVKKEIYEIKSKLDNQSVVQV